MGHHIDCREAYERSCEPPRIDHRHSHHRRGAERLFRRHIAAPGAAMASSPEPGTGRGLPGHRHTDLRRRHVSCADVCRHGNWPFPALASAGAAYRRAEQCKTVAGGGLLGFGLWNIADVGFFHWILGIHRIRVNVPDPMAYDLAWFVLLGLAPTIVAWFVLKGGRDEGAPNDRGHGPLSLSHFWHLQRLRLQPCLSRARKAP
jgi:hypothetical protein